MTNWFYQIKARQNSDSSYGGWIWPPVFSGKVEAETKADARAMIDQEYGQKFPMRVLSKDIETAHFLLSIHEIDPDDTRTNGLFTIRQCQVCAGGFRVIDHYNNQRQRYAGRDFCSDDCKVEWTKEHDARLFTSTATGKIPPVIYKIDNKNTGLSYVGQTIQPFTLRWWQHFAHGTNTKFHQAIDNSHLSDWAFSVIEVIAKSDIPNGQTLAEFICGREQYWIDHFDTIKNGYNTATAKSAPAELPPMLEMMGDICSA